MGCESCTRVVLMVVNVLFFFVGAAALGVGIWVVVDASYFLDLLAKVPDFETYGQLISDAGYIIIAGGAAIFLIAFLGCCGAWKRNKCLLITYAIVVAIVLFLEIATVVVAYFFYDQVSTSLQNSLTKYLETSYDSNFNMTSSKVYTYKGGDIVSRGIDAMQLDFSCCGLNNYTDYGNIPLPVTCCAIEQQAATVTNIWKSTVDTLTVTEATCPSDPSKVFQTGCFVALKEYISTRSIIFMAIAGGALGVQLLLILFAICLVCAIRSEEQKA